MEVSSSHQLYVFLLFVVLGMVCGAFFDVQRFLRKKVSAGNLRTILEDFLFTTFIISVTLGLSYHRNNGEIRYYEIMGAVSGALFYMAALSNLFTRILEMIFSVLEKVLIRPTVKICSFIMTPIKKFYRASKKVLSKLKRKIKSFKRRAKKRKKLLEKRIKMF